MYIHFFAEPDIIAVKEGNTIPKIIGVEVKGYRGRKTLSLAPIHEGLGQTLLYLVNPEISFSDGTKIKGSIFDEVYLCYPYTENYKPEVIEQIRELKWIGLIAWDKDEFNYIKKPGANPFVNDYMKNIFMDCINMFEQSNYKHKLTKKILGR